MLCEIPKLYECKIRTARKSHTCCECGGEILSGYLYYFHRGLWTWGFRQYKTCTKCELLSLKLAKALPCGESIPFGGLYEEWAEFEENKGKTRLEFRSYVALRK